MAYKLTKEMVYEIEHDLFNVPSVLECTAEQRADIAVWQSGVRDMANAIINALNELNE